MQSLFKFRPIYKERLWGGRAIERVGAHHHLPPSKPIGESWEISDRPGDESVIANGEFSGKTIRWLLDEHGAAVMGRPWPSGRRFPLLIKILDATDRLSLQVHPPPAAARELGGEPKTEMWCLLEGTAPHAALLAGLKRGVERADFERCLRRARAGAASANADFEALIHRAPVRAGDAMLVPAGRIHAIGAGCLLLEIQQNSDTSYRVYDWDRVGLDGKPRELQIEETLRCTSFQDFEPQLAPRAFEGGARRLAECEYFQVRQIMLTDGTRRDDNAAAIVHVLRGTLKIGEELKKGETALVAAGCREIQPLGGDAEFIAVSGF